MITYDNQVVPATVVTGGHVADLYATQPDDLDPVVLQAMRCTMHGIDGDRHSGDVARSTARE